MTIVNGCLVSQEVWLAKEPSLLNDHKCQVLVVILAVHRSWWRLYMSKIISRRRKHQTSNQTNYSRIIWKCCNSCLYLMIWNIPVNIRPDNKIIDASDEKKITCLCKRLFSRKLESLDMNIEYGQVIQCIIEGYLLFSVYIFQNNAYRMSLKENNNKQLKWTDISMLIMSLISNCLFWKKINFSKLCNDDLGSKAYESGIQYWIHYVCIVDWHQVLLINVL